MASLINVMVNAQTNYTKGRLHQCYLNHHLAKQHFN